MCPVQPLTDVEIEQRIGRVEKIEGNLAIGEQIPDITLMSTKGHLINLSDICEENHVILFFYPGDKKGLEYPELMGCTPEACYINDDLQAFRNLNIRIFGISMQPASEQKAFAQEQQLQFELLSDSSGELAKRLNISMWQIKESGLLFSARETLIVKQGGTVVEHWRDISFADIDHHIQDVLNEAQYKLGESLTAKL